MFADDFKRTVMEVGVLDLRILRHRNVAGLAESSTQYGYGASGQAAVQSKEKLWRFV